MEHFLLTFWAASHVSAVLSSSQPLLLAVLGLLLLMTSAATRVIGGGARVQQSNDGKHGVRTRSLSKTSGPSGVPESVRHLTQNAAAREHANAEGMYHRV